MHYLVIITYCKTCQDELSFPSPLINCMTHCVPYDWNDLPFVNKAGSAAFK